MARICAVLVTYNRAALLREALNALRDQTMPIDEILVVDNACTDDTIDILSQEFPTICVLRLPINVGSAGGNAAGIQWALQRGFEWVWMLDDDSIAAPGALEKLFSCRSKFPSDHQPDLLASKVVWTDGSLHPMNIQKPKLYDPEGQFLAAQCGAMSIRFSSFVSMLIHRRLIEAHGLPIASYFMWNDDVEYSARMLKSELGVLVPESIVVHKTPEKHVPASSAGGKYRFEVRNKLWILKHSRAFNRAEKWWMFKSLTKRTWRHLRATKFSAIASRAVTNGLMQGLFQRPS